MTITVVGAGAIGGLLGAYLSASGLDVLLVDRDEQHVSAIQNRGLTVEGVRGRLDVRPRAVLPGAIDEPLGVVILAVKAQDTVAALHGIQPHLRNDGFVVSLQNEFNEDIIAATIGRERTVGGLPDYGGALVAPGVLEFTSEAPLYIGELDGRASERVRSLVHTCNAFIETEISDDIVGRVWSKNVYLLQHKLGFAASTDDDRDALYADAAFHRGAAALVREGLEIAHRHGVRVPAGAYFEPAYYAPDVPEAETANHIKASYARLMSGRERLRSSGYHLRKIGGDLWWDIVHLRRPSETSATAATYMERARAVGIEPKAAETLLRHIAEIEAGDRARGRHNLDELLATVKNGSTVSVASAPRSDQRPPSA